MAAVAYQPRENYVTLEEYLSIEERSGERHEWLAGRVYNMAGASAPHNTLTINIATLLNVQLRGKSCRPWAQDMRVKITATGLRAYPDVLVACPPHEWDDELPHTLLNPAVIIEVLSPATAAYDRGEKFNHYRRIESLHDYLLVDAASRNIVHLQRRQITGQNAEQNGATNGEWLLRVLEAPEDTVELPGVGCRLNVGEVYERVEFEANDPPPQTA